MCVHASVHVCVFVYMHTYKYMYMIWTRVITYFIFINNSMQLIYRFLMHPMSKQTESACSALRYFEDDFQIQILRRAKILRKHRGSLSVEFAQ